MADLASTRVFGNLKVTGVLNGDGSGLTGTASLRATGTTKADVGLGSVDNYSRAHYDSRYLAADGKAVDSDMLDGKHASEFALTSGTYSGLRAQATTKTDVGLSGIPNTNGSTSNYLRGDGSWVTPPNTTYSAGTGISLTGTTFSLSDERYTTTEKNKLAGIAAGAQVNVGTNLAMGGSGNSRTITSSTGSNVAVPVATTSNAGFMATGDKTKLNGIESGAQVNVATNLGQSRNATSYTITSSTGSNTALAAATTSNAGVMSAADKTKLNGLSNVSLTGGTNVSVTGTYPNLTISATDTNTTYSAGNGISLSGTTFSVAAGSGLNQQTGGLAVDSSVIRTTGDQNLGGVKTFTTRMRVTGTSKSAGCFYAGTSNPTNSTRLNYDGNLHAFTFIEPSDIRMKTEIEPIENALDKVNSITGYNYTMKDSGDRKTGVIAQEVLEVLPEAVSGNQEEGFSVAYGNMVGLLINAVKELTGQVDELKNEINALKKGGSDVG